MDVEWVVDQMTKKTRIEGPEELVKTESPKDTEISETFMFCPETKRRLKEWVRSLLKCALPPERVGDVLEHFDGLYPVEGEVPEWQVTRWGVIENKIRMYCTNCNLYTRTDGETVVKRKDISVMRIEPLGRLVCQSCKHVVNPEGVG